MEAITRCRSSRATLLSVSVGIQLICVRQELHFYLDFFRRCGIHHPLSYYRTRKLRFEEEQSKLGVSNRRVTS